MHTLRHYTYIYMYTGRVAYVHVAGKEGNLKRLLPRPQPKDPIPNNSIIWPHHGTHLLLTNT